MSFIFKITTTTSPQTFVIPCTNTGTFNATVDYGDGTGSQTVTAYNDSNLTHSFATAGQHTITIDGTFPNVKFYDNTASRVLVDEVVDLGDVGWVDFYRAFRGCSNLTAFNVGTANTSSVTTIQDMFTNCSSLTVLDVTSFNTSSVTGMSYMFYNCSSLTSLNLGGFDTSSVTNLSYMFQYCSSLTNLDIKHFDVSNVTNGTNFLLNANNALTTTAYNELLEAWAAQDVQPNVPWHFGDAQYTVETIADWYSPRSNSSLSIINNKLVSIAGSTNTFGVAQQVDNLIVGNRYKIVAALSLSQINSSIAFRVATASDLNGQVLDLISTGTANIDNAFTSTATTMYVGAIVGSPQPIVGDTITIDAGITVKEITNYTEANAASEIEYSQENVFGSDIWTNPANNINLPWVYSGPNIYSIDGSQTITTLIQLSSATELGSTYQVNFKIENYANGVLQPAVGSDGASFGQQVSANGSYSQVITKALVGGNTSVQFRANSDFSGTLIVESIKKITNAVEYKNIPQSARELYSLEDDTWTGSNELVVNGDFANDLSGWVNNSNFWNWSSGRAFMPLTSSANILNQECLPVGAQVRLTFDIEILSGSFIIRQGTDSSFISAETIAIVTESGSYSYIFTVNESFLGFWRASNTSTSGYIDNVSVKEIVEVAP